MSWAPHFNLFEKLGINDLKPSVGLLISNMFIGCKIFDN